MSPGTATPDDAPAGGAGLRERAAAFRARRGLEVLVVTLGADGALLVTEHGMHAAEPVRVTGLVDTVGAGDAFAAVTILGLLKGWPHTLTLTRAVAFAAAVCRHQGATAHDPALYEEHLASWGDREEA